MLNGFAVVVRERDVDRLATVPGVARVWPSVRYRPLLDRSTSAIRAAALWAPTPANAGAGLKIGIVDDGIDVRHPFFNPSRFRYPAGFPKGNARATTAKVIVARAFAPPGPGWRYARRPFDPLLSEHATHVAGIAAGNHGTRAGGRTVSGVAPGAYLGNYKVLTVPTIAGLGLNGNSPEIAAGIEAAVRDGMDVINLSLGEPEIEPSRDLVVRAIDAAADAGVVPAVAAGNDFGEFGAGSIVSPGSAAKAISAGAVTPERRSVVAEFSSAGPTPVSLRLKPDVAAPGVSILSSVPDREGTWTTFSGTSMASPHVAGAAALLRQRHPTWTVQQLKSALVLTGEPATSGPEAPPTRQGGGLIDLQRADAPLVFARPTSLSFGFLRRGRTASRTVELSDAGGGAGAWAVSLLQTGRPSGLAVTVPPAVAVPGSLTVSVAAEPRARQGEASGFVVLTRGTERRRVPYWARVTAPALARKRVTSLSRPGTYEADTRSGSSRVRSYRYPADPSPVGVRQILAGPERVFRVRIRRPVANFGVAIVWRGRGVQVEPRIVRAGDENRLVGQTALPLNLNPYVAGFRQPELVAGVVRPAAGVYDVVFDGPSRGSAGRFRFRFWVNDASSPSVRLLTRSVAEGGVLRIRVADPGAGVDPRGVFATVDGRRVAAVYIRPAGVVAVPVRALSAGRHRLVLDVSDHQEAKNMENVPAILPNTRRLATTFVVR